MTGTEVDAEVRRTPDRAILGVIFLLLFVMAYSEEIVSGAFQVLDQGETEDWRIALVVVDIAILAWIGMLKRSISRDDHGAPRLWRWWWAACRSSSRSTSFSLVCRSSRPYGWTCCPRGSTPSRSASG